MEVKLVSITPKAEETIAFCARRSSSNPTNPEYKQLLTYCLKHKHWSIFEQASASFEIVTSRAIGRQLLRHRSFCFQEFSQRYSNNIAFEFIEPRRQAEKNRQASIDDLDDSTRQWFIYTLNALQEFAQRAYTSARNRGIAKESARFLLPESSQTNLIMTGNLRSWIHYIQVRTDEETTQKEHRDIAMKIKQHLAKELPTIAEILHWSEPC